MVTLKEKRCSMSVIFNIATASDWEIALSVGFYQTCSLETEGFIHCSKAEQVISVADSHFPGRKDLILLLIDTSLVEAEIRYENLGGGENLFPHIYGPLNLDALVRIHDFQPDDDGTFAMPDLEF